MTDGHHCDMGACTLTLDDGTHYDLLSLSNAKNDYEAVAGNETFRLNVCRGVVSELWKVENPENVGGYIPRLDGDFSIGSVNSTLMLSPMTNEPVIILSQGSPCPNNPAVAASTVIHFICDPTTVGSGSPALVAALPPGPPEGHCAFFFDWKTEVACPTNKPITDGAGWSYVGVFAAFAFVALLTYLVFHTLYNRFALGLRGWEQLPRPHLPSMHLPNLSSAFRREPRSGGGMWGSWRRGGYGHVGAHDLDDEDEEQGFAGRFSLDDDAEGDQDARALAGDPSVWRDVRRSHDGPAQAQNKGSDSLVNL